MNDETYDLLQIDAHKHARGWAQDRYAIAQVPHFLRDLQPLYVLLWLQAHGYLPGYSEGMFQANDDGCSIVVTRISNGEPIFAIEYGAQS